MPGPSTVPQVSIEWIRPRTIAVADSVSFAVQSLATILCHLAGHLKSSIIGNWLSQRIAKLQSGYCFDFLCK
jgi:hypothetical protein